jgi:hypothetical protein
MNLSPLLAFIALTGFIGASSDAPRSPELTQLVGNWGGMSLCQVKPSACHDETVVYHLSNPHDGKITIQADKIIDGKPVAMGTSAWTYDKPTRSLKWEMPRGTWKLVVDGDVMDGTLTGPDNVIFRKVHLQRAE